LRRQGWLVILAYLVLLGAFLVLGYVITHAVLAAWR
jgi:hypothetical protein